MALLQGKQISTGSNGIKAANVDVAQVSTLSGDNVFIGTTQVPAPTIGGHGTTKIYVDNLIAGNVAVPTTNNKNMPGNLTTANGQLATSIPVVETPASNGFVEVVVNGISIPVASSNSNRTTNPCYFSGDGGTTARASNAVVTGDFLYWNGSIAGYQLSIDDRIDFDFDLDATGGVDITPPGAKRLTDLTDVAISGNQYPSYLQYPLQGQVYSGTTGSWTTGTATLDLATSHPYLAGDTVSISNITPSGYNGTYVITSVGATTISYSLGSDPGVAVGQFASVVVVIAGSWATNVATLNIGAHSLYVGAYVNIFGVTPSGYNTTFAQVTAVTANTISYALLTNPGSTATGGSLVIAAGATWSSGTATINIGTNSLVTGQRILVNNFTPSGYNGAYTVTSVASHTVSYALATNPGGVGKFGQVISQLASSNQVLTYSSGWKNLDPVPNGSTTLSGLTDVSLGSLTNNDRLVFNGSHWENQPAGAASAPLPKFVALSQGISSATIPPSELALQISSQNGSAGSPSPVHLVWTNAADATVFTGGQLYTIGSGSWSGGVATISVNVASTSVIGDGVTVLGCTPSGYNGQYFVTAVAGTLISYALASDPGGPITVGGTATDGTEAFVIVCNTDFTHTTDVTIPVGLGLTSDVANFTSEHYLTDQFGNVIDATGAPFAVTKVSSGSAVLKAMAVSLLPSSPTPGSPVKSALAQAIGSSVTIAFS